MLCNNEASGEISIAASGGTAPFEYSLDGAVFQTGSVFKDLSAGSYAVTIKDANEFTNF